MAATETPGEGPVAITNPVTGVSIGPAETGGQLGEVDDVAEIRLRPGASGPAEHVHRRSEERFEVLEGDVTFRVDGRERTLGAGTVVRISPGTPHAFRNKGDERARLLVRTIPDSERLGEVVATLFGLAHDGEVDDEGRPGPFQAAVLAEETIDETYFTAVPYGVQRAFGDVVGPIGRALGYRPTYDRYLTEDYWEEYGERWAQTRARTDAETDSGSNSE
jgi:mannose-6-phosphate isomerase-like protein (cupin superfamily)